MSISIVVVSGVPSFTANARMATIMDTSEVAQFTTTLHTHYGTGFIAVQHMSSGDDVVDADGDVYESNEAAALALRQHGFDKHPAFVTEATDDKDSKEVPSKFEKSVATKNILYYKLSKSENAQFLNTFLVRDASKSAQYIDLYNPKAQPSADKEKATAIRKKNTADKKKADKAAEDADDSAEPAPKKKSTKKSASKKTTKKSKPVRAEVVESEAEDSDEAALSN